MVSQSIGQRVRMVMAGCLIMALAVGLWIWRRYASQAPPERPSSTTPVSAHQLLATAAARRAKSPSIPGLHPGVPQLVPGLEEVDTAWTPSLSDDLCTIVFAASDDTKSAYELYIADRPNVSSAFANLHAIESCASRGHNIKPTLSPDGLELIFVRLEAKSLFYYAQRSSRSSEFGEPAGWPESKIARPDQRVCMARFLDPLHVLISVENTASQPHFLFFVVERASQSAAFGPPQSIALEGCGGVVCLRPNRLVGYYGIDKGLFVQARSNLEEALNTRVCLVDAAVCGAVAGPIWVAPAEDVAFYCSAGPGQRSGRKNLWMIRFPDAGISK